MRSQTKKRCLKNDMTLKVVLCPPYTHMYTQVHTHTHVNMHRHMDAFISYQVGITEVSRVQMVLV